MKKLTSSLWLLLAIGLVGCATDLSVENQNSPDRERALSSAQDVEALIGGSYLNYWSGTQKYDPSMTLSVTADENTSSWGNFGMQDLSSGPRRIYDNSSSYRYRAFSETPWYNMYRAISNVNDGLAQIDKGLKIGANGADTPRAKAFAKFVQGIAHGFLALLFDKAFIFGETVNLETDVLEMKPYSEVMEAAISELEAAIAICNANSFTLPDTWINGLALTNVELGQLAHSYIARFMAQVARDPNERASANWAQVISHGDQGITQDFAPIGDGDYWWDGMKYLGQNAIWARADYKTIGPADTSGAYQNWLNTPVANRQPFDIHTADRRITDGTAKGAGTDFKHAGTPSHRPDRGTYHFSFYQHYRYIDHFNSGAVGPMPAFLVTEVRLLRAEAMLRLGQTGGVAAILNTTRAGRGQLPAATDADPAGSPSDAQSPAVSASLWSKLKHEKKIETYLTGSGVAFFDRRGFNELVSATPLHFPVPGKELELLQREIYTFGGGGPGSAPKVAHYLPELQRLLASPF